MLIGETLRVALDALRANKMRSLLTMLGIVIGIGAVIAMVALGNGAQASVRARIAGLGTTLLEVNAKRVQQGGVASTNIKRLVPADVRMIVEHAPHVTAVQPQQDRSLRIVWRNRNANIDVVGTTANYLHVRKFEIEDGEMFTDSDENARRRVAVIGAGVLPLLGIESSGQILGDNIRIIGEQFKVIGVLKSKGRASSFGNPDEQILIPFMTGRFKVFGNERLNDISALAASEADIPEAMLEIQRALRRSHRLRPDQPDDFTIRNQADFLTTMSETSQTFGSLLAGIAAVSLMVGGIGIMNIMLVSVTERTREIGIRKALGATRRSILLQFLTEATLLCVLGGAIGVAAGVFTAWALQQTLGWDTAVDGASILIALGVATATGLVFGVWPARQAARLDPIEALRFE